MAKRGADKQLTQNNVDDDDRSDESGEGDFKKASQEALAGRKIRGLPKRKGMTPGGPSAPSAPKPAPFAAPNPFAALSASTSTPGSSAAPPSFASFGGAASSATNGASSASPFSFGATSSFSAPASTSSAAPSAPSFSFTSAAAPSVSKPAGQSAALTYYTALRALNVSLLDALSAQVDQDAFVDLAGDSVLERLRAKYVEHRAKIQSEFDKAEGSSRPAAAPEKPQQAAPSAFEIPDIFKNPPKPVPIADLTDSAQAAAAGFEIPDIFKNPPKPVPIADLTPKAAASAADDGIPDIFKNPPKPVPIADLTAEAEEAPKKAPAPPAAFSFAGNTVQSAKPSASSSGTPVAGGFVFKPDAPSDPAAEKSSFTFPTSASVPTAPPSSAPTSAPSTSAPASAATSKARDELKPPSAPKMAPAKLTNPPSKPSPLRFGQSVSPPTSPDKDAAVAQSVKATNKSGFSFGATFGKMAKGEKEVEPASKDTPTDSSAKEGEGEKKAEDGAPAKPAFAFGSSSSPFAFGSSPSTTSTAAPAASGSGFSFGSTANASSADGAASGAKPFAFGSSTFGASSSSAASPAGASAAASNPFMIKPSSSPPISSTFGASTPPSFGFGAALQGKDKDKAIGLAAGAARNTGFGFGSSISGSSPMTGGTVPSATGFSFGAASADKNEPAKKTLGFSFGAAATTTSDASSGSAAKPSTGVSAPPPAFSFTASTAPTPAGGNTDTSAPPSVDSGSDSRAQTPGANPFAAPGEGEEGEVALHSVRGKVWRLGGPDGAKELGIANIQVKEREGEGKVRLLARNETNGNVLINFSLFPAFTVRKEKVFATFTGFDADAKPVMFRVRVKTKEMLDEFDDAVEDAKKKLT